MYSSRKVMGFEERRRKHDREGERQARIQEVG